MDPNAPKRPGRKVKFPPYPRPRTPESTLKEFAENLSNVADSTSSEEEEDIQPAWDYNSNYPMTVPWRNPHDGTPGPPDAAANAVEDTTNSAAELGLLEIKDEPQMIFFQFPVPLPKTNQPASTKGTASASAKGKEKVDASTASTSPPKENFSLKDLPVGHAGKMLVYKRGAVKLKVQDKLFDVSPGIERKHVQQVVAINTEHKHCCAVAEPAKLGKNAVVTLDVDFLMDSVMQ